MLKLKSNNINYQQGKLIQNFLYYIKVSCKNLQIKKKNLLIQKIKNKKKNKRKNKTRKKERRKEKENKIKKQ